jgi:hypothetical protein
MPELIGDVLRCILAVFDKQTRIAEREALIEDYEIEQYERPRRRPSQSGRSPPKR